MNSRPTTQSHRQQLGLSLWVSEALSPPAPLPPAPSIQYAWLTHQGDSQEGTRGERGSLAGVGASGQPHRQSCCDAVTYVIAVGLLRWGWRWRSVPGWGDSSCSGGEKASSPTHKPSGGKDSPGRRRPSWGHNANGPGGDASPAPASKRDRLAMSVMFPDVPPTPQRDPRSWKRKEEPICEGASKAREAAGVPQKAACCAAGPAPGNLEHPRRP